LKDGTIGCASEYGAERASEPRARGSRGSTNRLEACTPGSGGAQAAKDVPIQRVHAFGDRSMTFEVNVIFSLTRARMERAAL
jgi:hypothetical protein